MEIELIDKTIETLSELDTYFERLSQDNLEKVNICTKSKELVFWLTYYRDKLEEAKIEGEDYE